MIFKILWVDKFVSFLEAMYGLPSVLLYRLCNQKGRQGVMLRQL